MPRFCKNVGGMRLRLLLKRLSERFLLENTNHGEESEGIGRSQDLRGLGERGSGGTIKGIFCGNSGYISGWQGTKWDRTSNA